MIVFDVFLCIVIFVVLWLCVSLGYVSWCMLCCLIVLLFVCLCLVLVWCCVWGGGELLCPLSPLL